MNKNPFSIYDFMGYLFPGVICSVIIYLLIHFNGNVSELTDIAQLKNALLVSNTHFDLDKSVMFIVFSYILGHIVSYLSSLTVEIFAVKVFDYPSTFLLKDCPKKYSQLLHDYFVTDAYSSKTGLKWVKIKFRLILKVVLILVIFPIGFTTFTFGYLFDLNGWIARPLDGYLRDSIKTKQYRLANKLQISHPDVNDNKCDYHRIIQHYVYINIPGSQKKTDNYIALYGFLRCISLIFSLAFCVVGIYCISTIDIHAAWDVNLCVMLVVTYCISYLTFLGFMKFFRRFTLENYMTLLAGMYDTNAGDNV